jgi:hypothetical protein
MYRRNAVGVSVLLSLVLGCASSSSPNRDRETLTPWEITTGRQTRAPVERGAILDGGAVVATNAELYRVRGSETTTLSKQPEPNARLVLAPGGRFYAWVRARAGANDARSLVELFEIDGGRRGSFETDPTAGPADVYLGRDAKVILTRAPLLDPEGARGPFRYTFWNVEGQKIRSVDFDRGNIALSADGTAVAILGLAETRAYSASGEELWRVAGRFRMAALSSATGPALLNPSEKGEINQIVIAGSGPSTRRTQLPTPVHKLAISPDGTTAAAAGDRGSYFFIDVAAGTLREQGVAPSDTGVPYIFDLEVANPDTLLLGVLHRLENDSWPTASVVAVQKSGRVSYRKAVAIREALAGVPGIDVLYGASEFIAHTRETAFQGRIDGRP